VTNGMSDKNQNRENTGWDYDFSRMSESFQALIGDRDRMFQLLDSFPMPIEVFDPDGTAIYLNQASMDMFNIKDASMHVGRYNLLRDPACEAMFGREIFERAFRGEAVSWSDAQVTIEEVVARGVTEEKPFEAAFVDVYFLPVWNGEKLTQVIGIYILKRMYQGVPEVARAKEFIDSHWLEGFDAGQVAGAVNISGSSLYHLFKQHAGMTPKEYYNKVKVERIKEKLVDKSLTVAEAFSLCGADSRGEMARTFKKLTGMTPTEYRGSL